MYDEEELLKQITNAHSVCEDKLINELGKPTEITVEDIDNFVKQLENSEIKPKVCFTCGKKYYLDSYGHMFSECDECFFKRIPEKERIEFFKSFLID